MKTKAFAKINLGLRILGKRADGFHELDTTFARVGLADELEFENRGDGKIAVETAGAKIREKENLVFRAAWLVQKFRPHAGVTIRLTKKIPLGGGLGGGSADAAAVLKSLPKFWGLKISRQKLFTIAAGLGSDVPFFLTSGIQRASGRGEIFERVDLPENFSREIVIATPPIEISSEFTYKNLPPKKRRKRSSAFSLVNDFEEFVFKKFPLVETTSIALREVGAKKVFLSGSGASVVGIFADAKSAKSAAKKLSEFVPAVATKIRN